MTENKSTMTIEEQQNLIYKHFFEKVSQYPWNTTTGLDYIKARIYDTQRGLEFLEMNARLGEYDLSKVVNEIVVNPSGVINQNEQACEQQDICIKIPAPVNTTVSDVVDPLIMANLSAAANTAIRTLREVIAEAVQSATPNLQKQMKEHFPSVNLVLHLELLGSSVETPQ